MKFLLLSVGGVLLLSCTENGHRQKQIERFLSTEIILPDTSFLFNKTLNSTNLDIPAKMVVYFDAETCSSCALSRIWEWDEVSQITQTSEGQFQVLFIFTPKLSDLQAIKQTFLRMHFEHKLVYLDGQQNFIANNPTIPKENMFHTFLLDQNNRVVLVGNPLASDGMWTLFRSTLDNMLAHDGKYVPE